VSARQPAPPRAGSLRARSLLRPHTLFYLYRRRLRAHAVQELLAGLGVAIAVALVFATLVASATIVGSAGEVVHTVVGPASLQLRARSVDGFQEGLLARVERLPSVKQAAPLLEQTATLTGPTGRRVTVNLAGADTALVALDGLAHTLPIATLAPGGLGLSATSAQAIGIPVQRGLDHPQVLLALRGRSRQLRVSAVLGAEALGALSQASVAVMPLQTLQRLAALPGQISRIVVQVKPGAQATARAQLQALAGPRVAVAAADQDVATLHQALRPSDQASGFFAAISALLGLLFAFNALLLTVPARRRAIADLRLIGTKRAAIVQMFFFESLCLGTAASLVGLAGGYALARGVLHQSPRYLAEAFTLGTHTTIGARPLLLAFGGGVLATCLASAVPLLDLRRAHGLDAVYREDGTAGHALGRPTQIGLALAALALLALASILFALEPALALAACAALALATMLAVPLTFAGVLRAARALAARRQTLTILPVALSSLRATTLRSLALAATGAVALFGGVALGGARADLLRGIGQFAHSYAADASIWVGNPGDNQATLDFPAAGVVGRIARIPGVVGVRAFQGGFLDLGNRRVWLLARPPGAARQVLTSQLTSGDASVALARLAGRGWIALSRQIATEHRVGIGSALTLPTPTGPARFRIAALTTNLAWSPGAIFMSTADYSRFWASSTPTALGVQLAPGASLLATQLAITRALGPASGLEVSSAHALEGRIDALTSEGLDQLGEISTLLLVAAILALAAALTSAIWQRRVESALMLGAGCVTGAVAGIYGQAVIDGYLAHVTGFPVAGLGGDLRPLEIFVFVVLTVLALAAIPGWRASRVSPALALHE
jgi:putative ABC transport system permease protein